LRLRPALILAARVLPSTPPLFHSVERHFFDWQFGGFPVSGIERWKKWDSTKIKHAPLAVGDGVAVFSHFNVSGIGVVREIGGEEMYYMLFSPNVIYHKKIKDVRWNERNWRWETNGTDSMRKLEPLSLVGSARRRVAGHG
jgi:hypothetical protein